MFISPHEINGRSSEPLQQLIDSRISYVPGTSARVLHLRPVRQSVVASVMPEASNWEDNQEDTMRKLLLVNIAVAALGAAALMPGRADATTLGTAAGLRSAVDGAAPIEEVQYWRYRHHRRTLPRRW